MKVLQGTQQILAWSNECLPKWPNVCSYVCNVDYDVDDGDGDGDDVDDGDGDDGDAWIDQRQTLRASGGGSKKPK